jgi:DmsE family decaheme c-type cytochrome
MIKRGGAIRALLVLGCATASIARADPTLIAPADPGAGPPSSQTHGASFVGVAACRACHPVETEHWSRTTHGRLFRERPRNQLEARQCEACHGPGSDHMADPAAPGLLVAFTRERGTPPATQNATCLRCHSGGSRARWPGSIHERADLGCSDCHDAMSSISPRGLLREEGINETCFICHPGQRRDFRKRSHMPLLEGKISCADCHDPHGADTPVLIRADSVNQLCYRCHADKRGPFLWEHAPVVESCLNCHLAHGSSRLALLRATPPALCQQCHVQSAIVGHATPLLTRDELALGGRPDERLMNRGCVNCHSRVHGSNHPSGARLHR